MDEQQHNYKLSTPVKMKVLAMMARGDKYGTILSVLEKEHGITYSRTSLTQLRKNNKDSLRQMELMIMDNEASEAVQIKNKALRQLNKKLDRAADDQLELDSLDEEYRAGNLSLSEYRRKRAGLLKISVTELLMISKEMNQQDGTRKGPAALPGGVANGLPDPENGGDPRLAEALLDAIKRGDTVALSQMVITPNA